MHVHVFPPFLTSVPGFRATLAASKFGPLLIDKRIQQRAPLRKTLIAFMTYGGPADAVDPAPENLGLATWRVLGGGPGEWY
ncbi:hypothetical protein KL86PLE_41202 [uncultured Pleomorphomonas sp.]|uniref:Uncharacterized protein n=1 Tax=uncultured Pleomorphomonas sp. TaxID=442121 RepID=A0A212LIT6_9HYPH|nr:hypothetical protein KL86PLE_41202 [uncultured Pleomorphomonas sp.]